MLNSVQSYLPRPAAMVIIAACLAVYAASPDDASQRAARVRGTGAALAMPLPHRPDIGSVRHAPADNILLAGLAEVADGGPLPLAAAMAIPLLAFMLRRRLAE